MIYYTSDLHFGCTNKYENRSKETDRLIIDNWNSIVTNGDDVYILGDIGKIGKNQDNEYICQCISVLKGRKHLILGNHDKELKDIRLRQLFVEVCDYKEIRDPYAGENVVMSHYPILMWNEQHKEWIHLYGHLHNSHEETFYQNMLFGLNGYFESETEQGRTDCPQAIEDAKINADVNEIKNIQFINADALKGAQMLLRSKIKPDVVIVDPPRKGCSTDTLSAIVRMDPKRLVYVSCDPATLARDVKILTGEGYELQKVQPVDLFPQTVHVETVCLLSKVQK